MRLAAIALVALAGTVAAAEPNDWPSLNFSQKPADKKLVADIKKMDWWDACYAWGREERAKERSKRGYALLWFLDAEKLINGKDRGNAAHRTVDLGMTECGILAAKGQPDAVNQTTNASGRSAQYVYRNPNMYFYTEPTATAPVGIVRSIQH